MAIKNFIPTIWSETLYEELDKQYIGVANCTREFEGDIKNMGSVVKICGVGSINVGDYTKNTNMSDPQTLSDTVQTLTIDRAKCFNFQIDDVDRAQATPKLMNSAMKLAASALADEADKYVYSLFEQATLGIFSDDANVNNILDIILEAKTLLYHSNVTDANEVVLEVSPEVAEMIIKAKIGLCTDNTSTLESGCIGTLAGCKVFVSKNILVANDTLFDAHFCALRTKRAIAFAEQLSEIEAYRPEKRFADAVKGLHLYGAQIVYPKEIIRLELYLKKES